METILYSAFANDVLKGLTAPTKHLSSKYFYNDAGSRIFMQIMKMPEYYPTGCEFEILAQQSEAILQKTGFTGKFNIVEFGSGDGIKTKQLLKAFMNKDADFTYMPIDISQEALDALQVNMLNTLPSLNINPQRGDYFDILQELSITETPNLFLFLGGNIGNYNAADAKDLLDSFYHGMKQGDKI